MMIEKFVVFDGKEIKAYDEILILNGYGIKTLKDVKGLKKMTETKVLDLSNNRLTDTSGLEELVNLETLYLAHNKITHISGLDSLINLKELILPFNQIENIKNLDSLKNLEELVLFRNHITKITGLKSLKNLKRLRLHFNRIDDIEGLESLEMLEELDLSYNYIKEFKNIENLYNLKILNLSNNRIRKVKVLKSLKIESLSLFFNLIEEIPRLKRLRSLKNLYLSYNKIKEIRNLKKLKNLKILDLSKNQIKKITGLTKNLNNLIELNLSKNYISEITGLNLNLKNLNALYLYSNQISRIEGLEELRKLEILYIFDNKIEEIFGLGGLSRLKKLNLSNNHITYINGLDDLISLERLDLGQANISVIQGFKKLSNLRVLNLFSNGISKIQGLDSLNHLEILELSDNKISVIEGLEKLNSLKFLGLGHNLIEKVPGLKNLTSLEELYLQNSKIAQIEDFPIGFQIPRINLQNNELENSKEYVKLLIPFINFLEIDFDSLRSIREEDIDKLNSLIIKLLNSEKYGYNIWKTRPNHVSLGPDKQILDNIISLYNLRISLINDNTAIEGDFEELSKFLQERQSLQERDTSEYLIYDILKKLFLAIKESDNVKRFKILNEVNLEQIKIRKVKFFYNQAMILLNLINSLLNYDKINFQKIVHSLLSSNLEERYLFPDINVVDSKFDYIRTILHKTINNILKTKKNEAYVAMKDTQKRLEMIKDPLIKELLANIKIEKVVVDDTLDSLSTMRIFFAQMNLRKNLYTNKGEFYLDNLNDIKEAIDSNLEKALKGNSNFVIFPEYSFPAVIIEDLIQYSKENEMWIIGGLERLNSNEFDVRMNENTSLIISPNDKPIIQKKHFKGKDEPILKPGTDIKIIKSKYGSFSVLICADLLEPYLLSLIREEVDFIIVPSFNSDTKSFTLCADHECYVNLCYIIICNIVKYGSSCIHGPLRDERALKMPNFPFVDLNLNEFSLHRRGKITSEKYKRSLKKTLYDLEVY